MKGCVAQQKPGLAMALSDMCYFDNFSGLLIFDHFKNQFPAL